MKLISWNVRGLGKPRTVRRLRRKLKEANPLIVFLIETKLSSVKMDRVRRKCGYLCGIDVASQGRSGDLSLAWKPECNVVLRSYSNRHIDVIITNEDGSSWRCTGFYGAPETHMRDEAWRVLRSLDDSHGCPWLVIGDFNEILFASEKRGGLLRSERQMTSFRNVLEDCSLSDIGYRGRWFTWQKGVNSAGHVRERLDRGVANSEWWESYPNFSLTHLAHTFSDHCPLLLDTNPQGEQQRFHTFHFEAAWLMEELAYGGVVYG
ncbi:hypothetical protein HRI_002255700 [Hibiscus trionum]|uniref:Endonuclease/exonuclease/phosphatase domain-containing protein n=1 Tax=Hibiscus trionum TaxID=183268 RepID=A0A9W7M2R9_HIBTR|nr:hypothetical protein HRI_002255700 [Hibiscus trionum]